MPVFGQNLPRAAAVCKDRPNAISFGESNSAEFRFQPVLSRSFHSKFKVFRREKWLGDFVLNIPGRHNISNATGVIALATILGVDVEKLLPLIQASMVRSGVVEYKAPFILQRDFSPNFPLRLMLKDIRLALDAAKESRVRLPGLEAVEEVYDVAAEEGYQDQDYAATLTLLEKWAGVEVKAAAK